MNIDIKKLTDTAILPAKATKLSAGYDIYSDEDAVVYRDRVTAVKTGWAIKVPYGYKLEFVPRSGLAFKYGITLINTPGTIDSDFLEETKVGLIGLLNRDPIILPKGSRIAQMMLIQTTDMDFCEVKELSGNGEHKGFGSTGA
jgi:dUTP pyrophosphatase